MSTSVLVAILLVAAAPVPEPKPANERYGDAVVAILKGSTRVEIVRIEPALPLQPVTPVAPTIGGYAVSAVGKEPGEIYADALSKVLFEEARLPLLQPTNIFEPWIGFRLWKGKEKVEVLFDLKSRNLQVIGYDADGKILKQIFSSVHAATYNALLKRAQEAFPDDVALRQIKEITDANRVEIIRVNPGVSVTPVAPDFGGYAVSAVGKNQGEAYAAALNKVLREEANLPTVRPVNIFEPQIGFRLWKDKEKIEVLFDPQSRNVQVIGYDADGKMLKQTLNVAHPATFNALVKRAQEAFPDDAVLRQFKEMPEK